MAHIVSSDLLEDVVTVHVIGCGGTGSAVLPGLAKIHRSRKASMSIGVVLLMKHQQKFI